MAEIIGSIRIIARTQAEAEEIAGYLHRISGGHVWFRLPERGQKDQWLAYGEVDVPPEHDTRTWKESTNE